jgi:hypothetical protein
MESMEGGEMIAYKCDNRKRLLLRPSLSYYGWACGRRRRRRQGIDTGFSSLPLSGRWCERIFRVVRKVRVFELGCSGETLGFCYGGERRKHTHPRCSQCISLGQLLICEGDQVEPPPTSASFQFAAMFSSSKVPFYSFLLIPSPPYVYVLTCPSRLWSRWSSQPPLGYPPHFHTMFQHPPQPPLPPAQPALTANAVAAAFPTVCCRCWSCAERQRR